jgi:DNA-binding response OmpR family regulator
LIDDDPTFLDIYGKLLERQGYDVGRCATRADAKARLAEVWDAVLLDQKLSGEHGPNDGIDLLGEADFAGAKVILVTGYASDEAIERAFSMGAFDYLEKGPRLRTLLAIKLEQIVELARERRFGQLSSNQKLDLAISASWKVARNETDTHRKGRALEELLLLLFRSIDGFGRASIGPRSKDEEFDIVVPNESPDPYWKKESLFFIAECKNWSSKVGPAEVDRLTGKLDRRYERASLGFIVAPGGFTEGVRSHLLAERKGRILIVPIGHEQLDTLVSAKERNGALKDLHGRAVLAADPGNP